MAETKTRIPLTVDVRMDANSEEIIKEDIIVIIEDGENDIRISLISEKNIFFHVVHYMNSSIYETSFRLNQRILTPFSSYSSIVKKLIASCNDKPKEFTAQLIKEPSGLPQILSTGALGSSSTSKLMTSTFSSIPSKSTITKRQSIQGSLSSQNEAFHLDFISITEFKTFELLSCQFVGLPDDVVKRVAQQRYDEIYHRNLEMERKLAELDALLKIKKTPSALLSQSAGELSHEEGSMNSSMSISAPTISSLSITSTKKQLGTPPNQSTLRASQNNATLSNSSGKRSKDPYKF